MFHDVEQANPALSWKDRTNLRKYSEEKNRSDLYPLIISPLTPNGQDYI